MEGNYTSEIPEDIAFLDDIHSTKETITIKCIGTCFIRSKISFFFRQFREGLSFKFEGVDFVLSEILVQNIFLQFSSVNFLNSKISNLSPIPGELSELKLSLVKVNFTNDLPSTGIEINNTFVAFLEIRESFLKSCGVVIHVQHLNAILDRTSLVNTQTHLNCTFLCFATLSDVHITSHEGSAIREAALSVHGQKVFLDVSFTTFEGNAGGIELTKEESGVLESWLQVRMKTCIFNQNTKWGNGGAFEVKFNAPVNMYPSKCSIEIDTSRFVKNMAFSEGHTSSSGGALHIDSQTEHATLCGTLLVFVNDSLFVDNFAENSGGAIFIAGSCVELFLKNSHLIFSRPTTPQKGIFIQSHSTTSIEKTQFQLANVSHFTSLLDLHMLSLQEQIRNLDLNIKCLPWIKLEASQEFALSLKDGKPILQKALLQCAACPQKRYIRSDGDYMVLFRRNPNDTELVVKDPKGRELAMECSNCPAGAECPGADLQSKSNFWGFETEGEVEFQQCAMEYCCQEEPCQGFDQCSGNRNGTLCGNCKEGYSLSIMSSQCIPNSECTDHWVWFVAVMGMIVYMLWYTFKNDTFLIPGKLGRKIFKKLKTSEEDVFYIDKGYFGILTYFVQVAAVMRLTIFQSSTRIIDLVFQQIESYTGLMLSIEISYVSTQVCPLEDLTTTHKMLFKLLFLFGIFGVWAMLFLITELLNFFVAEKIQWLKDLRLKLIAGLVEIIKYTYLGLTLIMFSSLTCIQVGKHNVWFYDGSVECYSKWQIAMIIFGLFYVLPFPFMLYLGMNLLTRRLISRVSFFLSVLCPTMGLLYWLGIKVKRNGVDGSQGEKAQFCGEQEKALYEEFVGGYSESERGTQYWECVVMVRRLLISATTLIPSSIIQLSASFALCLVFLLHHSHVKPFKYSISNKTETLSLSLLVAVAAINLLRACFTYLGVNPYGDQVEYMNNLGLLESMFVVFLFLFIILSEIWFWAGKHMFERNHQNHTNEATNARNTISFGKENTLQENDNLGLDYSVEMDIRQTNSSTENITNRPWATGKEQMQPEENSLEENHDIDLDHTTEIDLYL